MSDGILFLSAKAACDRLNTLIKRHGLGTPDDRDGGFVARASGDLHISNGVIDASGGLQISNGVIAMCWDLYRQSTINGEQWEEMVCFLLSQTPQGCPADHTHVELPEGWHD